MITVIIASYKYGHLAAQAIESVLCQTRQPERILFVDDGAGDCCHLKELYPTVEFIFREKNFGIVENFQDMLMRVDTEKCLFLGADNWLHPETLEFLDAEMADIVSYDIFLTGTEADDFALGLTTRREEGYYIWKGQLHGSSLYNTEKAQAVGYKRNPSSVKSEEDKMLFEGMLANGASRVHVNVPLLYYRRHKHNFQ